MIDRLGHAEPGNRAVGTSAATRRRLSRRLLAAGAIAVSGLLIFGDTTPSRSGIHWHQVSTTDGPAAVTLLPSARLATPSALADALRQSRSQSRHNGFVGAPVTASLMDLDQRLLPSAEALLPRADYMASPIDDAAPANLRQAKARAEPPIPAPAPRVTNAVTRRNFPQWVSVLEKSWAWDVLFDSACTDIMGRSCHLNAWQDFLDGLRGVNADFQLATVNREINRIRYREDAGNWGEIDYWAAPGEFFAAGGDCEDYAIAKYYSLKDLGFAPDKMRIVVLQDELRQRPHAVLVVEFGGEMLMLDNMSNRVIPWSLALDYRPFYSLNEDAFWLHSGREIS